MNVRFADSLRAMRPRESRGTPTAADLDGGRVYVRAVRTVGVRGREIARRVTRVRVARGEEGRDVLRRGV